MKNIIIVQSSLGENSKTEIICKEAYKILKDKKNVKVEIIDLRKYEIQMCTEKKITEYNKDMQKIYKKLEKANGYIFAYPVYNYCFSGVFKNFIDVFSYSMNGKTCGIINHSGGVRSWNQGIGELMKVLTLYPDMKIVQPTVHSFSGSYENNKLTDKETIKILNEMIKKLLKNTK